MEYCLFYGNASSPTYAPNGFTDLLNNKSGRDPKYLAPAAVDYSVAPDSPAAAAGKDLVGSPYFVTNDIFGVLRPQGAWDMGPYEGNGGGESALAAQAYVRTNGDDSTGAGTVNSPWATIGYALGHVMSSGIVFVAGGAYKENVQLTAEKKSALIRGGFDPVTWAWSPGNQTTIVNGNGNSAITIAGGADSNTLSYLTLRGGTNSGRAGIEFTGSAPTLFVEGCSIVSNTYGIYNLRQVAQALTIRNSLIARNASDGLYFGDQEVSSCRLYNCTVADNGGNGYYAYGGWDDAVPVVKNTLFTGNNGYGIYKGGWGTGGSMQYCLFYGNSNGATWSSTGLADLGNNMTTNPPLYWAKAPTYYQLQEFSAAVDTGTNLAALGITMDLLGVVRPLGGGFDRGAYEFAIRHGSVFTFR